MATKTTTVVQRLEKDKQALIDALKEMPIVQVACKRSGVGRATYYRWRGEDDIFKKLADEALAEGELLVNDMSESQLISLIKEKKFSALHLWLRHHHPKYSNKIEIIDNSVGVEEMTEEQEATIKEALKRAKLSTSKTNYAKKRPRLT